MPLFTYRRPKTGQLVQAFSPEEYLKTPTPTSSFAVPCASKSIALIQLPAQSWAATISKSLRAVDRSN
jgi:hypothetical protein